MAQTSAICSLNYLLGTIATAYKGVITSLVAKDFCMTVSYGATVQVTIFQHAYLLSYSVILRAGRRGFFGR
jgi:hypothetical protein